MHEHLAPLLVFDAYRLHHTIARLAPVTRMYVDMLTPKTERAVIRIAVALHVSTAVLTGKILNKTLELLWLTGHMPAVYGTTVPNRKPCARLSA